MEPVVTIGSGASHRYLGVPGEAQLERSGTT